MQLDTARVVLVHPKTSVNVGAVCRAMKTMGLTNLAVVGAQEELIEREIRAVAIHASDVYDSAQFFDTLGEALSDCSLSVAVSRRIGQRRNKLRLSPRELPEYVEARGDTRVALVFGSEEHGLTNEEVAACSTMVTIPSSPEFPSLNLSHAVQIVTYEIFAHRISSDTGHEEHTEWRVEPIGKVRELVSTVWTTLNELGVYRNTDGSESARFFHDIFVRAGLRESEIDYLKRIFEKIRFMGQ
ncbi:MAG: RNA methyltransferase [Spirochaetota bacterium]